MVGVGEAAGTPAAAALAALQQHVHVLKTDRLHLWLHRVPWLKKQGFQPFPSDPS